MDTNTVITTTVYYAPLWFVVYFLIFGVLTILGGVMGYLKAKSVPSLVAGSLAGTLLLVGTILAWTGSRKPGAVILLLVSLALLGRFTPSLLRNKLNPALYIVPLSLIGALLSVYAIFG